MRSTDLHFTYFFPLLADSCISVAVADRLCRCITATCWCSQRCRRTAQNWH